MVKVQGEYAMERLKLSQRIGLLVLLGLTAVQMAGEGDKLGADIISAVRFLVTAMTLLIAMTRYSKVRGAIETTGWVVLGSVTLDFFLHHPIPQLEFAQCATGALLLLSSFLMRPLRRTQSARHA